MKFSTVFALGAFALPAIASPLLLVGGVVTDILGAAGDVVSDLLEPITDLVADVEGVVAVKVDVKRDAVQAIAKPQDIIDHCNGLLLTVKIHTGAINNTVSSVPAGTKPTPAHVAAIQVQLNLLVDAVKAVVLALGAVTGVIECTVDQVKAIVSIVVAIVLEIVCTLLHVVKSLNLQVVLGAFISNICKILAGLILVLEHVVGGVLKLVLEIINVPFVLQLVGGILGGLIQMLAGGKIIH